MTRRDLTSWSPFVVLAGVMLVLFAPLLLGEKTLFWGLPSLQFYPWRAFAFDELSAGRFPALNPYNGAGAPLAANYQTALFYPPNWLHLLISDTLAMNWLAVLHLVWAGVGMWMFTGSLGAPHFGRGVGMLAYALGGYGLARMASFPTVAAYAWIPWLFWALNSLFEKRGLHYVGLLSLITAMLLLTGHAQTAFYGLALAGLFTLWQVLFGLPLSGQTRLRLLLMAGGGVLLGVGIASVQLLLTAELLGQSQRSGGVDYKTLTNYSFAPLRGLTFLTPYFFGSPADGSYLTPDRGAYFEDAVYIGLIPLLAAFTALVGWLVRRKFLDHWKSFRTVPFWFFVVIIGVVLATGRYGPVYRTLYENIPTFDSFREPTRWMVWTVFALCVLAAIGVQSWARGGRVFFWTRLSGAAGAGFVVLGLLIEAFVEPPHEAVPVLNRAMITLGCWLVAAAVLTLAQPDTAWNIPFRRWQLAVLVVIAADLGWAAQGLNPTVPTSYYRADYSISQPQGRLYWFEDYEETVTFDTHFLLHDYRAATRNYPGVRTSLLPNLNMLDRIALLNHFDPLQPQYHERYIALIEDLGTQSDALLWAAGVGQVYGEVQPEGWEAVQDKYPSALAPEEPPIAWIVREAVWADDEEAETLLRDVDWSPQEVVILSGEAPQAALVTEADIPLTQISFFETLRDTPTEKTYRVVTDGAGYLVLAQTWYPGWSASIDGEGVDLERANLAFMAVRLPPGGGEVTFQYTPDISALGLVVTFVALVAALALIAIGLIRHVDDEPALL